MRRRLKVTILCMLYAMTGYGEAVEEGLGIRLRVLNGKGLEVDFHAPLRWLPLEILIRQRLQATLLRGSVKCHIFESKPAGDFQAFFQTWESLLAGNQPLKSPIERILARGFLLLRSDIFSAQQINETEKEKIFRLLDQAIKAVQATRAAEGAAIQKTLQELLDKIYASLRQASQYLMNRHQSLRDRYEELIKQLQLPQERIWQELGWILERLDVHEELHRLHIHCEAFERELHRPIQDILSSDMMKGRKLEHFAQEMQREAQTLAAKAQHAPLQHLAVEIRSYVEAIRQNVANIL